MKKVELILLIFSTLALLLGAIVLFYYSNRIEESFAKTASPDYTHLTGEGLTRKSLPKLGKVSQLTIDDELNTRKIVSEILLGMKWIAFFLMAIALVQVTAIYSFWVNRRKSNAGS